ncbi:MAG TPA: OmpA family protein [Ohtaekwangia sp.]
MKFFNAIVLIFFNMLVTAQPLSESALIYLNTSYDELNPVLSPDGRTLYMSIANRPENVGGKKDPGDIWISALTESGEWSTPVHGGSVLNNRGFNGIAGFSADGNEMFLLSHYDGMETPRTQGIAFSKSTGSGWSKPENITIPYFQNKSTNLYGFISPDKNVFVFSAETYGTKGVEDLYVTTRGSDGKWKEARNLGSTINTPFQELSPSLSADGTTLYFSTNGRKGNGSFDVYSSTRLDDTWTNWSEPKNMGPEINTEGRDLFYRVTPEGDRLFTTTNNSDLYGDVRFMPSHVPHQQQVLTASIDTLQTRSLEPVIPAGEVRVYGKVVNAKSGEVIQASVSFSATQVATKQIQSQTNAGFAVNVPASHEYLISVEANGYVSALEKLNVKSYEDMKELEMNFKLQPVEIGTTVNLKNVLFEQGKTFLLPDSYPELDMVVSFLKRNEHVKIELAGHTDNRGIPAQNIKLSQARVDKVKDYLVEKGIEKKRITGKGYGASKPIASNDSEETRQLNRRVEFVIRKM